MKSPAEASEILKRKWQSADQRELRVLSDGDWPLTIAIGKPSADLLKNEHAKLREHLASWRNVVVGSVRWETVRYQSAAEPLEVPVLWDIGDNDEWVQAAHDEVILRQHQRLKRLLLAVDSSFHRLLVRQLSLHDARDEQDVIAAARIAMLMEPGCGMGRPLRAIGADYSGVDSKFLERNQTLLKAFLDARFDGQCSTQGFARFLGVIDDGEHWLLVMPLADGLLPFARQRVRTIDLAQTAISASHILVVENEQCAHQLPEEMDRTVAILGAGLNLEWLSGAAFDGKHIGYWGDLDSWGMTMLASARTWRPDLEALLMDEATFRLMESRAVVEPTIAGSEAPSHLSETEKHFYRFLISSDRGRLEQEYLPIDRVHHAIREWRNKAPYS